MAEENTTTTNTGGSNTPEKVNAELSAQQTHIQNSVWNQQQQQAATPPPK